MSFCALVQVLTLSQFFMKVLETRICHDQCKLQWIYFRGGSFQLSDKKKQIYHLYLSEMCYIPKSYYCHFVYYVII